MVPKLPSSEDGVGARSGAGVRAVAGPGEAGDGVDRFSWICPEPAAGRRAARVHQQRGGHPTGSGDVALSAARGGTGERALLAFRRLANGQAMAGLLWVNA